VDLMQVRDVPLARGARVSCEVAVPPGAVVHFAFFAQDGDVGFMVEGAEPSEWAVLRRVAPHPAAQRGRVVAGNGPVRLTWDNEHGWFTSKTVFYAVAHDTAAA
jgi:hypothetical protein